ncbi:MAG TPA: hypothetical protein VLB27_07360 [candidate division Zixibacteria bacterium]|nr:hypothetical protein [candidate division Zixibacteria bacterium]
MAFYLKRLVVALALVGAVLGYRAWRQAERADAARERATLALVYAQLGVVEALYDDNDSLLQVRRDSVYAAAEITGAELEAYVKSFEGREDELARFWLKVKTNTDSLVALEFARLRAGDSAMKK